MCVRVCRTCEGHVREGEKKDGRGPHSPEANSPERFLCHCVRRDGEGAGDDCGDALCVCVCVGVEGVREGLISGLSSLTPSLFAFTLAAMCVGVCVGTCKLGVEDILKGSSPISTEEDVVREALGVNED